MPLFHYTAITAKGTHLKGDIEAANRHEVIRRLSDAGHFPVEIVEAKAGVKRASSQSGPLFGRAPSAAQITLFTRNLAMLLKAGMTLPQALALLSEEAESPRMKTILGQILSRIVEGKSLHQAFAENGRLFPGTYVDMIKVAEASGALEQVLGRIAEQHEREQKLRSALTSALLYPSILVTTGVVAIIVLLAFVVPKFKTMFADTNAPLPAPTRMVFAISDLLVNNGLFLLIGLPLLLVLLLLLWRTTALPAVADSILLRMPVIGQIRRLRLTSHFCRTLGVLLTNGVSLPQSLALTREAIGNAQAAADLERMGEMLRRGQDITDPMAQSSIFPSLVTSAFKLNVGRGQLAETSLYLAEIYEERLNVSLRRLIAIIEPVTIIIVSIFVGGIILSIIGAVVSINDAVS